MHRSALRGTIYLSLSKHTFRIPLLLISLVKLINNTILYPFFNQNNAVAVDNRTIVL